MLDLQSIALSDDIAVRFGQAETSYSELLNDSKRITRELIRRGVASQDRVAIILYRSLDLPTAVLGVLGTGASYIPIDPSYPVSRVERMIEASKAKIIVSDDPRFTSNYKLPETAVVVSPVELKQDRTAERESIPVSNFDALGFSYLIFTSGSTGVPKGVSMPDPALTNLLTWQQRVLPLERNERVLQFTSLSFDVSFQEIFSTLCFGGTLVLIDEETRRDPALMWKQIEQNQIQRVFLPFVALQQLAEAASRIETLPYSLNHIITAGEQLQATAAIRALFKRLAGTRLHNQYGPSETHVVTAYTLPDDVDTWPDLPPIGKPIDNVKVLFRDKSGQPADPAEGGELYFGGVCLADGYLNREDLTRERFVYIDGDRYYKTGDLGKTLPDGNIQYLGRIDHQVKIRGHRVELGEIETVLTSHEKVQACAVVAANETGENRLFAFVVSGKKEPLQEDELRSFLRAKLADYLVPAEFKVIDALPTTPSGKVDRKRLSESLEEPSGPAAGYVAPKSDLERTIAQAWSHVLQRQWISVQDNFFDIGGTSISIVKVRDALQQNLKLDLSLPLLFQYSTIASLAKYLDERDEQSAAKSNQLSDRASKQKAAMAKARSVRR